jgi:hypothetical protein
MFIAGHIKITQQNPNHLGAVRSQFYDSAGRIYTCKRSGLLPPQNQPLIHDGASFVSQTDCPSIIC